MYCMYCQNGDLTSFVQGAGGGGCWYMVASLHFSLVLCTLLNAIGLEIHLTAPLYFGGMQFAFLKNFALINKMHNSIAVAEGF